MKAIMTPISSIDELILLHELGATEFYCGYMPEYWEAAFNQKKYKDTLLHYQVGINKKDVNVANISSFEELRYIVSMSKQFKVELFITVNASFYPELSYSLLEQYFDELSSIGIENLIVNDMGLIKYVHDNYPQFKLTLSCLTQITNSYSVRFYKKYNIRRVVFPRHITINEIINIASKNPEIEFEFFVLSGKCIYDDGFCRCHHDFGQLCTDNWEGFFENRIGTQNVIGNIDFIGAEICFKRWSANQPRLSCFSDQYINMGCSLCSIWRVRTIPNICSFKIAGRGKSTKMKQKMVSLTMEIMELTETSSGIEEIKETVKKSFISNPGMCDTNNYCYIRGDL